MMVTDQDQLKQRIERIVGLMKVAADERQAQIVKWLRDRPIAPGYEPRYLADAIERSDHLQTKPD